MTIGRFHRDVRRTKAGRCRSEDGQSTVELALILPVLVAVAIGLAQVVSIVHTQVLVVHAVREAARQVAVDPTVDSRRIVLEASRLDADRLQVVVSQPVPAQAGAGGSTATVALTYRAPIRIPLIGLVAEPELTSEVTVWVEQRP